MNSELKITPVFSTLEGTFGLDVLSYDKESKTIVCKNLYGNILTFKLNDLDLMGNFHLEKFVSGENNVQIEMPKLYDYTLRADLTIMAYEEEEEAVKEATRNLYNKGLYGRFVTSHHYLAVRKVNNSLDMLKEKAQEVEKVEEGLVFHFDKYKIHYNEIYFEFELKDQYKDLENVIKTKDGRFGKIFTIIHNKNATTELQNYIENLDTHLEVLLEEINPETDYEKLIQYASRKTKEDELNPLKFVVSPSVLCNKEVKLVKVYSDSFSDVHQLKLVLNEDTGKVSFYSVNYSGVETPISEYENVKLLG